jgi:hypothetical protein
MTHHFEHIVNTDGFSCKVLLTEGEEGFTLDANEKWGRA